MDEVNDAIDRVLRWTREERPGDEREAQNLGGLS